MYSFVVSVDIATPPARVWHALCDPAEVVRWDTGIEHAIDAPPDYPQPGQHVQWRYRNGPFRLLHDRPQDVVPERMLRSLLAVGPFRFDETYVLEAIDSGTRLTAWMSAKLPVPLLSEAVEWLYLGRATKSTVTASLSRIKRLCESTPMPAAPGP